MDGKVREHTGWGGQGSLRNTQVMGKKFCCGADSTRAGG